MTEAEKFIISNGVSSMSLDRYKKSLNNSMLPMAYTSPMITEERQLNVAQMDVFSRLMYDRIIVLGEEINPEMSNIIMGQLMYLNSTSTDDVKMFINSPGGCISSGFQILDTMNFIDADVSTWCTGTAASMASIILSGGEKGKRYILPHGEVLIHQPLGGTGYAQASDVDIFNKHIQMYKQELYRLLSQNTGVSVEKIANDCDRDYWLTAEQALEYGIVDKIITKRSEIQNKN